MPRSRNVDKPEEMVPGEIAPWNIYKPKPSEVAQGMQPRPIKYAEPQMVPVKPPEPVMIEDRSIPAHLVFKPKPKDAALGAKPKLMPGAELPPPVLRPAAPDMPEELPPWLVEKPKPGKVEKPIWQTRDVNDFYREATATPPEEPLGALLGPVEAVLEPTEEPPVNPKHICPNCGKIYPKGLHLHVRACKG